MISLGADPEFFILDTRSGGVVPACGLFGGTKGKTVPIPGLDGEGYGYQEDNVMLEFNIPPAPTARGFARNIMSAVGGMKSMIRDTNANFIVDENGCSRLFTTELLAHPRSMQFGCSPDFSAYTQGAAIEPIPLNALDEDNGAWRFAGGHVHIGYDKPDIPPFVAAAFADVFLGLPAVGWDVQSKRREFYGTAGRFRPTPYGIEYRTLSNKWVFNTNLTSDIATRAAQFAQWIERTPLGVIQNAYVSIPWGDVRACIENESEGNAMQVLDDVQRLLRRGGE